MASSNLNIKQIILVPAIITLLVTILRLVGELSDWSPLLFSREVGGGYAIVGISWLGPIFGIYFALRLAKSGHGPSSAGQAIGYPLVALAVGVAVGLGLSQISESIFVGLVAGVLGAIVALVVLSRGWSELFKTLLAYALAARIPVVIVMFFAILGQWGTHYDAPPPDFPEMGPFATWALVGLIPQLTFWIAFTTVFGGLFGGVAAAIAGRGGK
jgi:hypothetical protein